MKGRRHSTRPIGIAWGGDYDIRPEPDGSEILVLRHAYLFGVFRRPLYLDWLSYVFLALAVFSQPGWGEDVPAIVTSIEDDWPLWTKVLGTIAINLVVAIAIGVFRRIIFRATSPLIASPRRVADWMAGASASAGGDR